MKNILTILILITTILGTKAQDIIVKNDKTEIKAKIEEITETTIKYKKFEMLDGPIYNISVSDVFMIMYKNGTKEYIQAKGNTQPTVQNNVPVSSPSITGNNNSPSSSVTGGHEPMVKIRKGYYSFEGNNLRSHSDYVTTFEKYGYNDLVGRVKEARTFQYAGSGLGITCMIVGLATDKIILVPLGGVVTLILGLTGVGARENAVQQFNSRATKKIGFNEKVEIKPLFASDQQGNHVGIVVRF
jgi:hypothetical protein